MSDELLTIIIISVIAFVIVFIIMITGGDNAR